MNTFSPLGPSPQGGRDHVPLILGVPGVHMGPRAGVGQILGGMLIAFGRHPKDNGLAGG